MTYLQIDLPLSMGNEMPISLNQTRNLTQGKIHIWRACIGVAYMMACADRFNTRICHIPSSYWNPKYHPEWNQS